MQHLLIAAATVSDRKSYDISEIRTGITYRLLEKDLPSIQVVYNRKPNKKTTHLLKPVDFVVQHLVNSCTSRNLDSFCFSFSMNVLQMDLFDQRMFDWSTCYHFSGMSCSLWEVVDLYFGRLRSPPPPPCFCSQQNHLPHWLMRETVVVIGGDGDVAEEAAAAVVRAADTLYSLG